MNFPFADMTFPPDSKASRGTGPTAERQASYQSYLPPCNQACPAGENIQAWLDLAQAGNWEEAWQTLIENNWIPRVATTKSQN